MCFHSKQTASAVKLENRFSAKLVDTSTPFQSEHFNGFEHPKTPIIRNTQPDEIQLFSWGLLPENSDDSFNRNATLLARIEDLQKRKSYRNILNHKCLILLDGLYEWKHLDNKGKIKEKYLLTLPDDEPFAVAGLWSEWENSKGEMRSTYTMITTEAVGIMREIHNHGLRMPVILTKENERKWLMGEERGKLNKALIANHENPSFAKGNTFNF